MKNRKTLLLFLVFLLSNISILSQTINKWERVEIPDRISQRSYLDIFFLPEDPNYAWICGYDSQVSMTTDGGETWKTVKVDNNSDQLESIHFANKNIGYTSGLVRTRTDGAYAGIFKTTDGGLTWEDVSPIVPVTIDFWGTYFYDEDNGLIAGNEGCGAFHIYKTTDGGQNWDVFSDTTATGTKFSDLWVDGETGIGQAISSGYVWKSTDYGSTWDVEFSTGGIDWAEELSFYNNSFTIPTHDSCQGARGGGGSMIFTPDRGKTLNRFTYPGMQPMYGSFTLNDSVGWGCGLDRQLFKTEDAGKNWELINCGIEGSLDDIYFLDDTTAWVVGDYVYKSAIVPTGDYSMDIKTIDYCSNIEYNLVVDSNRKYNHYEWNTGDRTSTKKITLDINDLRPLDFSYKVVAYDDSCSIRYHYEFIPNILPTVIPKIEIDESSKFCEGDTVRLNVDKMGYPIEWSTGDTSSTITVTSSGMYYVDLDNLNGCITSDSVFIDFIPLPEPEIYGIGKNDFCIGDSMQLTADKIYPTYFWINSNGDTLSKEKTIIVKEDDEYQLIVANEAGCIGASAKSFSVDVRNDTNQLYIEYNLDSAFELDTNTLTESTCGTMKVYNISWSEHILYNVQLDKKLNFSMPQSQFPIAIPPRDSALLEFCFQGDSIGDFDDLITIDDLCSPHIFNIETHTKGFEMEGITRCDVSWRFRAIELTDEYFYESSSPYPNPAAGKISLDYMEFGKPQDGTTELYLYGSNGELIEKFDKYINEQSHHTNGSLTKGRFELELNLKQGVYFIQERNGNKTNIKPIVIMR